VLAGWVWQSQLRVLPPPGHSLHDMTDAVRDAGERKTDTVARLEGDADIWVATASAGRAHLVPLSLAWDGAHVILATPANSPTARNAAASGQMRLALGTSRDVTIIEAAAGSYRALRPRSRLRGATPPGPGGIRGMRICLTST
jgi:hypothetical protein